MAAFGSLSLVLRGWEVFGQTQADIRTETDVRTHKHTKCDRQMFGRTNILSVTDRCLDAQIYLV